MPFGKSMGVIQWGLARYLVKNKPDTILASADMNYLSFWTTMVLAKLLGIPFYAHGHGLYKKTHPSRIYLALFHTMLRLVTGYVAYAPIVRESFLRNGLFDQKVQVAHNSIVNPSPILPGEKTGTESGVLFVGRLRTGNNLRVLLEVLRQLRNEEQLILPLHVIGSGQDAKRLQSETTAEDKVVWHGEVYDADQVRKISRDCFVGCYPGMAGLSVIHMLSLSLPVITHDDMCSHMGPEPSFIRDGINGILFDSRHPEESLYKALRSLATNAEMLVRMQKAAYQAYFDLTHPPLADRLWAILSPSCSSA